MYVIGSLGGCVKKKGADKFIGIVVAAWEDSESIGFNKALGLELNFGNIDVSRKESETQNDYNRIGALLWMNVCKSMQNFYTSTTKLFPQYIVTL